MTRKLTKLLSLLSLLLLLLAGASNAQTDSMDSAILQRRMDAALSLAAGPIQLADLEFEIGFPDRAWLRIKEVNLPQLKQHDRARFFLLRGRLEQGLGRLDLAEKNFRQVAREAPSPLLARRLHLSEVDLALAQGNSEKAAQSRDRLNNLSDAEEDAALATALILAHEGQNEAALSVLRALVKSSRSQGLESLALDRSLAQATLLNKMNREQEAWRLVAKVLDRALALEQEWLGAKSLDHLGEIRRVDMSHPPYKLYDKIIEKMPRTRLGLRALSRKVWSQDWKERRRLCELGFGLAVELDEPHIAALFARYRSDFSDQEEQRKLWADKTIEMAESRQNYGGKTWLGWVQPGALRVHLRERSGSASAQLSLELAERETDSAKRLALRSRAFLDTSGRGEVSRSMTILPLLLQDLTDSPADARQRYIRSLYLSFRSSEPWSANSETLNLNSRKDAPLVVFIREWLKKRPVLHQRLVAALLQDLRQAEATDDKASIAGAQKNLAIFLAFLGRDRESLLIAKEAGRTFEAIDTPLQAAELDWELLELVGEAHKKALVERLLKRYQGYEDYSLSATLGIARYYQANGEISSARNYLERYLSAPSGRVNDPRRSYVFLELAALQRNSGEFVESLKSLKQAREYKGVRDWVLNLATAQTHLKMGAHERALKLLETENDSNPSAKILAQRLRSRALWAQGRKQEALSSDQRLATSLNKFLQPRYHPDLRNSILSQPIVSETLVELKEHNPNFTLDLTGAFEPLNEDPELPESKAAALERMRRNSKLGRTNLSLDLSEMEAIRAHLQPDDVVVHLFPMEHSVGVVVISSADISVDEYVLGTSWRRTLKELKTLIESPTSGLEGIERRTDEMGDILIAPWVREVKQKNLHLFLSGELENFPFEILTFDGKRLMEEFSVCYLDLGRETSSWPGAPKSGCLVDGSRGLPGAKRELDILSSLMPQMSTLTLSSDPDLIASTGTLIHVCSHGAAPDPNSLVGRLYTEGEELGDSKISQLPLKPSQLVVLSSCSGGLDPYSGRNSLAHHFRAAGAGRVVATLWQLDDQTAPLFFEEFYKSLRRGNNPDLALNHARAVVRAEYPHPYFWGGVVLYRNLVSSAER